MIVYLIMKQARVSQHVKYVHGIFANEEKALDAMQRCNKVDDRNIYYVDERTVIE
jgi:hypothetical protein